MIAAIGFAVAVAALVLTKSLQTEGTQVPAAGVPAVAVAPPVVVAAGVPSFDVVRVGEKGDTVTAGRAQPQAEVVLHEGDRELGRAQADERGEWVLVPTLPLAPGVRSLWLESRDADGTARRSAEPVIVVVPEGAAQPVLALAPRKGGAPRLMQGPGGEGGPVTIDLIDRDAAGALFVGGRAVAGAQVHVYLDNRFLGYAAADGEGAWKLVAAKAAARGLVRADMVDQRGKVRARVEVELPQPATTTVPGSEAVTVEAGASLWTIARRAYGDGAAYTVIYAANKDNIRDPDRIYPGQVVQVPKN